MADAGSNPLGSGNPMNAGGQGGFQVNEGAANANIRGAMPRGGGGGGGIIGAIRDIADRKGRQADRERDNVDYAWRRGIDYEHASNLSKLQSGLRVTEIGTQGKQERKTVKTVGKQTRATNAQSGSIQANQTILETNAQNDINKKSAKNERKGMKLGAKLTEAQSAASHKRTLSQGRADVRNVGKVAQMFEPGKVASVAAGNATGNGMLRKPAPTAPKAPSKPRTPRKPPTAR